MPTKAELIRQAKKRRLEARERFVRSRKAVKTFTRQLSGVAQQVGRIVSGFAPKGVVIDQTALNNALERYADLIKPWAAAVSQQMVVEVAQRDTIAWTNMGREVGRELRREVEQAPISDVLNNLKREQVELISSLPRKAAERVHKLALEATLGGTRASEVAKEIMRTQHVTQSRAMLIARTETARTAAVITESRAQFIGSEQYIWRTARDGDVRELHKKLEGQVFNWNDPPVAGESGERANPGMIYNCRCHAEPILPDIIT